MLAESEGTLTLAVQYLCMVDDHVEARLDSLRHFIDAIAQTMYQRFFGTEPSTLALARVLTFRADETRLKALRDQSYAALRDGVVAADAAAAAGARGATVAFCVSETPKPFVGWP